MVGLCVVVLVVSVVEGRVVVCVVLGAVVV